MLTGPATSISLQQHAVRRKTSAGLTMLFDRAKGVMYELNESASAVVALLDVTPRNISEIVDTLVDQFEADRGEIEQDVATFVEDFVEAGLLVRS